MAATGGAPGASRASDFALRDVEGRTVQLSDFLGRQVVVLSFWATWCAPCMGELPHLERIYQAYKDQGFVVVAISMDDQSSVANVVPVVRRYGLSFPVLLDDDSRVTGTYNPKRSAPLTVIIGKDGAIAKVHEGYSAGDEIALEADVKALLATPASGG